MSDEMTQAAFARLLGVRRQTVHRWIRTGRIVLTPSGRIAPDAARARLAATESSEAHHQENARRNAERRAGGADDAHRLAMLRATLDLRVAQAGRAQLEVERRAASLVARADVDAVLADFEAMLREELRVLPARLAPELAAHQGNAAAIHRTLTAAAHEVLTRLADRLAARAADERAP